MRDLLGRALDAFERHAEEESLGLLLEAWRHAREARVAALVERVSARLTRGLLPLECEPGSLTMREHRPLDLPRLLVSVLEGADRGYPGSLRKSLRAFREWPADPRFTPVLVAIARMPVASHLGVPDALCQLLEAVGDPRALEPLREVRVGVSPGSEYARWLDVVLQQLLARAVVPPDAETSRLCEAWEEGLVAREAAEARHGPLREALLARVYEDPDDVAARMVLADHLLEQGDPLGELISLQCQPEPDAARVQALLEAHRLRWEAPLGPSITRGSVHFEKGFPASVHMNLWEGGRLPEPGPAWSTVREIDWGRAMLPDMATWLAHPHLRNVRGLWHVEAELARGLAERALGLSHLSIHGPFAEPERTRAHFNHLTGLPRLTHLLVENASSEDVRLCAVSQLAPRLVRFEARGRSAWELVVMPRKKLPVLAKLLGENGAFSLAHVIMGAAEFGIRALHIHLECPLRNRTMLWYAASFFERVEWS